MCSQIQPWCNVRWGNPLTIIKRPPGFSSFLPSHRASRFPVSTSRLVGCNEVLPFNSPYAEKSTFETNHIQGGIWQAHKVSSAQMPYDIVRLMTVHSVLSSRGRRGTCSSKASSNHSHLDSPLTYQPAVPKERRSASQILKHFSGPAVLLY